MKKQLTIVSILLLVLIYSCRKSLMPNMDESKAALGKFDVNAAREHVKSLVRGEVPFDGKIAQKTMSAKGTYSAKGGVSQTTVKTGQKIFYPFWDRAMTSNFKGKMDYVEVPIALSSRQIRLYQFPQDNIKLKPDASVAKAAFQRLVVYKDSRGRIGQRLLTYIPDKQYIMQHGYEASTNRLSRLNGDFFGYIEYKNWSGDIVSVLRIENGKVVRRYSINSKSKEQLKSLNLQRPTTKPTGKVMRNGNATSSTIEEVCDWVWIPIMETVCEVNDDGNPNDENLNEVECTLQEVGEYADLVCTWVEVPDPEPCPWGDCDEEPCYDCENPCTDCEEPDPEPDPCAEVGSQSSEPEYKNKATDLKSKTNLKYESGYEEKKNGTYDPLTNSNADALNAAPTNDTKGYIHNHVNDYETGEVNSNGDPMINKPIKMFSPADVNTLMNLADQNRTSGDFSQYYVSMVSSYGHYMIKFTGSASDIQTTFGGKAWAKEYKDFMDSYTDLERGFLRFMKEKMGIEGVELFEVKNNGTIKSIGLKADGKTKEKKDC